MINRKKCRKIILLIISLFLLVLCIPASAENSKFKRIERALITVAIPYYEGIDSQLEESYMTGYTHEYLTKISQISPINFEFIYYNVSNEEILKISDDVKNGVIDIMGGALKNEVLDDTYLYSQLPYGSVNSSLLALNSNSAINERILLKQEHFTIGVSKHAVSQIELFTQFCEDQKLNATIKYYETYAETEVALRTEEVDVIVGRDTSRRSDFRVVLQMDSKPYYFISATSKTSVIDVLDDAMKELELIDEKYIEKLHRKYYSSDDFSVELTKEEQEFIKELRTLKVGVIPNNYPLQYFDSSTNKFKGILVDLVNQVSSKTGLKIEYVSVPNLSELRENFEFGVIDLILGVPYDYEMANQYDFLLSSTLVSLPVVHLSNRYNKSTKITAMAGYLSLSDNYVKIMDDSEIFKGLSNGDFSEAYMDGYRAQYFSSSYSNIDITPSSYDNYELSIGLYNKGDYRIMNIIEQGIRSINDQELYDIIYNNVIDERDLTFFDYLKRNPIQALIMLVLLSSFAIVVLLLFLYKTTQMKKVIAEEREKYEMLSQYDQLTNVLNQQTFKKRVQSHIVVKDSGTLMTIDLDNFKEINDSFGHFEGDKLLEKFANALSNVYGDYIVGRSGGDEFMIYLDDIHSSEILENLFSELVKEIEQMELGFKFTVSSGATIFNNQDNFDNLYRHVDKLLYEVKEGGRNGLKIGNYRGKDAV